jgi:hypothetical protein
MEWTSAMQWNITRNSNIPVQTRETKKINGINDLGFIAYLNAL